jgi:predicted small secreted protein
MKVIFTLLLVCTLAACSTISGLGKDIQTSADWTKEKISGK